LNSARSFKRTVNGAFDTEPKLPKLQNLAGHVAECKGGKVDKEDELISQEQINLKQSVKMMKAYLKKGELNPEVVAIYKGFLRIFAAWIFDESLPWTTGEAPTLQMLFKYLKIMYPLPSDTTVHNQLVHIFAELHGKVVREFLMRFFFQMRTFPYSASRQSNPRLRMQRTHGPLLKWCTHLHVQWDVS
jgi:hypothetical protein